MAKKRKRSQCIPVQAFIAPRQPGGPIYLTLDYVMWLVNATAMTARDVMSGTKYLVYGKAAKRREKRGELRKSDMELIVDLDWGGTEFEDLLTIVATVKGGHEIEME